MNSSINDIHDIYTWQPLTIPNIHDQFTDVYHNRITGLSLTADLRGPKEDFHRKNLLILDYISANHPDAIVRTKANIIMSRKLCEEKIRKGIGKHSNWTQDLLREDLRNNWYLIKKDISSRWCVSILEVFAEHGSFEEKALCNGISILYNINKYGKMLDDNENLITNDNKPMNRIHYRPDDTFINMILRLNRSMVPVLKPPVMVVINEMAYASHLQDAGFSDCAKVWKMIFEGNLDRESAQSELEFMYPNVNTKRNYSLGPRPETRNAVDSEQKDERSWISKLLRKQK